MIGTDRPKIPGLKDRAKGSELRLAATDESCSGVAQIQPLGKPGRFVVSGAIGSLYLPFPFHFARRSARMRLRSSLAGSTSG